MLSHGSTPQTNLFTITFAGSDVTFFYDTRDAQEFLSLLFIDVGKQTSGTQQQYQLSLNFDEARDTYHLREGDRLLYRGSLGVKMAAQIYDTVIFHLLNQASAGIALHAGGVISSDRVILLPGQSGSGKSTLTFWLTSQNCSYLTDELIFISLDNPEKVEYFSRPLCLKPGSMHILKELLTPEQSENVLVDRQGAVIPHRLLNREFKEPQSPPSMIILPSYQPDSKPQLEPISKARLCTLLMGCHVNARNLPDHGFTQILDIARSTPAYRLNYANLQDAEHLMSHHLPN